jgi:hypothetical protein
LQKTNKHIAIVLLGIFTYPIFFQSIHIVWHHSHGLNNSFVDRKYSENEKSFDNVIAHLSNTEVCCPFCEYKFSINNLSKSSLFECNIFKIDNNYIDIVINQFRPCIQSKKSPRAPPLFTI